MAQVVKSPSMEHRVPRPTPRANLKRTQTMVEMARACEEMQPTYKSFPEINRDTPKKHTNRVPVFLGHDGTLYDIDYIAIAKKDLAHSVSADNIMPLTHSLSAPNFTTPTPSTPPTPTTPLPDQGDLMKQFADSFPQPAQFETFFDYEQGLLSWKQRMETGLGGLHLPNVMGRKFNRPRVVEFQPTALEDSISTRSSSSLDTTNPSDSTPSPSTPTQIAEIATHQPSDPSMNVPDDEEDLESELEVDPWDSVLVPTMPNPLDYDTYVDYEEALLRWALLCSRLPFLPPHAEQLKEIIPIQPVAAPDVAHDKSSDNSSSSLPEPSVEWKVRLVLSELPFFEPLKRRPLVPSNPHVTTSYPPIKAFISLSHQDRVTLEQIFAKRLASQDETLKKYGRHNKPLLPRIHGTLPKPYTSGNGGSDGDMFGGGGSGSFGGGSGSFGGFGGGGSFGSSGGFGSPFGGGGSVSSSSGFGTGGSVGGTFGSSPKLKVKPKMLRRTDLTKDMLERCMDCLPEYDGVKVEFKIPEFELYNIDLQRIGNEATYRDQLQKQVVQMQHADRNDFLNSWYYPTVPIETHHRHRELVKYLMTTSKFEIGVLSDILAGDMYLDKFQDLLSDNCQEEEDGSVKTYLQVFLNCITPENFPELLCLFEKHESRLLHAKLAAFIIETTQSTKGKMLCECLISNRDVKSLSFVAYGMTFFNEVPVDIYPWHADTYFAVKKFLGPAIEPLIIIFSYYYVNLICQAINKQPFLFVGLSPFINEARKSLATKLGQALQTQPDFVGKYVFRGMAHRSQKISHMLLFVLVQLLTQQNLESPLVQSNLRAEVTNLANNTRDLMDSKYMHVQLTARRIFAILMAEPWQDFLYADYQANPEQLLKDMLRPPPRRVGAIPAEVQRRLRTDKAREGAGVSTLCSIVLEMSIAALSNVTNADASKKRIAFLLDEVLFHSVFQHIVKHAHHIDQSTVALATLLYHLAKTYLRLGQITGTQSVKTTQRRTGSFTLTLSPLDIQKFLTFLTDVAHPDITIVVGVRKYMLATLRQLVKCQAIFDFVKKENDFYSRLLSFCRDGSLTALPVNKEAWKILYVIVHYHPGTMDYLNKSNTIHGFLELVATYSPNIVITNGIRTITMLFSMLAIEQRKPRRKDIKTLEKDIKILTGIFTDRRLFIKVHMIYKKFIAVTPGSVFFAIANFYNVLQTTNGCQKLLKNTLRSVDYKEGLDTIRSMYSPLAEVTDSPKEKKPHPLLPRVPSSR